MVFLKSLHIILIPFNCRGYSILLKLATGVCVCGLYFSTCSKKISYSALQFIIAFSDIISLSSRALVGNVIIYFC